MARLISPGRSGYSTGVSASRAIDAVLLAGPTASGKSARALKLAGRFGGIIINTDSMQVYRDLRIITARPTIEEEARLPHRLYGHVDAAENYSAGRWSADVGAALAEARQSDRLPILVGGTGLYFKVLLKGLAAVPPVPPSIREEVRRRLSQEGIASLYADLARRDPAMTERLMPADRSRITRALEVVLATGRSLADWHREGLPPVIAAGRSLGIFLDVERSELYRRIDARFDAMLDAGALEEVRALAQRGLDPSLPAMKAHGVPWLIRHLHGEITLKEAAEGGKRDTRRYTKRQATWFRNQLREFRWLAPDAVDEAVGQELHL